MKRLYLNIDWPLLIMTILITLVGLVNLYSATLDLPVAKYFHAQIIWLALGFACMILFAIIDYRIFERIAFPAYIVGVLLLAFVLFFGKKVAGSTRWLYLGPLSIQPSEIMKVLLIIALAKLFHQRERKPPYGFLDLIMPLLLMLPPVYLINAQPDLGTTIILVISALSLIVFIGVQRNVFYTMAGGAALFAPIAWFFFLNPYQKGRIITFLSPEKYALEGGYQVIQSKIAVGSGQLFGKGFLQGTQSKLLFLPKQYTDFVFSNFAEEWGFVGSVFLLVCFFMLLVAGLNIVIHAKEKFASFLAFGLVAMLFWQIGFNLAMEIGLVPVVGLPLPLMSYGGSSMITVFVALGLLQNISMRRYLF